MSLALCIYEVAGLSIYLYRAYEAGTVIRFSVFSIADLLVWTASPFSYVLFFLFPVMAGCLFLMQSHPSAAKMLLYTNRMKLFWEQLAGAFVWNGVITFLSVAVTVTAGFLWKKEMINWGSARSYLTMVMQLVLPRVSFAEVLFLSLITLFLRNLIFILVMLIFWWEYNMIYGVAAVSGICLAEVGSGRIQIVLGTVSMDYGFWANTADKAVFAITALSFLSVLFFLAVRSVKRKEFLN